jgi:hypothetical protein
MQDIIVITEGYELIDIIRPAADFRLQRFLAMK